jgi:hypothetical protein
LLVNEGIGLVSQGESRARLCARGCGGDNHAKRL